MIKSILDDYKKKRKNEGRNGKPFVSIYHYKRATGTIIQLALSVSALRQLGFPTKVDIMYDDEDGILYIKPCIDGVELYKANEYRTFVNLIAFGQFSRYCNIDVNKIHGRYAASIVNDTIVVPLYEKTDSDK